MTDLRVNLPEYDEAYIRLINKVMNGFHMLTPLLQLFPPIDVSHTGPVRYLLNGQQALDQQMAHTEFETIGNVDIKTGNIEEHTAFLYDFAQTYIQVIGPRLIDALTEVTDKLGNEVKADGQPLSWDIWLDGVEMIAIDFDDEGRPLFQVIMNPQTAERLREMPFTAEHKQRLTDIMERKRQEYYAAKRTRRLS